MLNTGYVHLAASHYCAQVTLHQIKKNHLDTVHQTTELEVIILEALLDRKRKAKDR